MKNMIHALRLIVFMMVGFLSTVAGSAQNLDKNVEKYRLIKVTWVDLDGKMHEGYTKNIPSTQVFEKWYNAEYKFATNQSFVPKDVVDREPKLKAKHYIKYTPKTLKSYTYNGDRKFVSIKFKPASYLGPAETKFMEVGPAGNGYSTYKLHAGRPLASEEDGIPYFIPKNLGGHYVIYKKDGSDRYYEIEKLKVEEELADCPEIVENYNNFSYNPESRQTAEIANGENNVAGGALAGIAKFKNKLNTASRAYNERVDALVDYMEHCGK